MVVEKGNNKVALHPRGELTNGLGVAFPPSASPWVMGEALVALLNLCSSILIVIVIDVGLIFLYKGETACPR